MRLKLLFCAPMVAVVAMGVTACLGLGIDPAISVVKSVVAEGEALPEFSRVSSSLGTVRASGHIVGRLRCDTVDGEVKADEAAAVRDHLAECPPCRERASVESTARKVLHARAVAVSERAPAGLRARCVAAVPSTMTGRGRRASVGWRRL